MAEADLPLWRSSQCGLSLSKISNVYSRTFQNKKAVPVWKPGPNFCAGIQSKTGQHSWTMLAEMPHTCGLQRLVRESQCCSLQRSPARPRMHEIPIPQQGSRRHASHSTHRPLPAGRRQMQDCRVQSASDLATTAGGQCPSAHVSAAEIILHPANSHSGDCFTWIVMISTCRWVSKGGYERGHRSRTICLQR